MTKKVRVENADNSSYKVVVQTWAKGQNGEPDKLLKEERATNPCDMVEGWIWTSQYLVVKEDL